MSSKILKPSTYKDPKPFLRHVMKRVKTSKLLKIKKDLKRRVSRTFATVSQSFNKLNSKSVQYTIFKGRSKNYNSELRSRHKSLTERKRMLKDGFRRLKEGSKLRDELGRRWQLISTLWKKNTISISEPYKKKSSSEMSVNTTCQG